MVNNLTSKDEIVKKNKFHKKNQGKKSESTMVNLTNLLLGKLDRHNLIKRKVEQTMKLRIALLEDNYKKITT
jgi:SHS2 domain-containing protein